MYWPNLKSVALPVPEIVTIEDLKFRAGVANPQSRKSRGVGGRVVENGTVRKSVSDFL